MKPDTDPQLQAILGRLIRLGPAFEKQRIGVLASLGLTREVSDLTISLYRCGPPFELNAGALSAEATLTTGTMTYRIDRAEAMGLVERVRDEKDRRGVVVRLTQAGLDLARRDVEANLAMMGELLESFSADEREALHDLLYGLLKALERRAS